MNFKQLSILILLFVVQVSAAVRVKRDIEVNENNEVIVTLSIKKRNIAGVAKLVEKIEGDFVAEMIYSKDALFTFDYTSKEIKFFWTSISLDNDIEISYSLKSLSDYNDQSAVITGSFFYLEEGSAQVFEIESEAIELEVKASEVKKTTEVTDNPILYAIQIAAGKSEIDTIQQYFSALYGIQDSVYVQKIGDIHKYYIGSFNDYFNATAKKEELVSKGVFGAYVISFNGEKRINVGKAIMLQHKAIKSIEITTKEPEVTPAEESSPVEGAE